MISSEAGIYPPVSIRLNSLPHQSNLPYIRSRVTPSSGDTIECPAPTSRLNKVDFPTFGFPKIAMVGLGMS